MEQVPPAPESEHEIGYVIIDKTEAAEMDSEDRSTEFDKIISQLTAQVKSSSDNAAHFKKIGDVKNTMMYVTKTIEDRESFPMFYISP